MSEEIDLYRKPGSHIRVYQETSSLKIEAGFRYAFLSVADEIPLETEAELRQLLMELEAERRFEWVLSERTDNIETWGLIRKSDSTRWGFAHCGLGLGFPEAGVLFSEDHWQDEACVIEEIYARVMCAKWLREREGRTEVFSVRITQKGLDFLADYEAQQQKGGEHV